MSRIVTRFRPVALRPNFSGGLLFSGLEITLHYIVASFDIAKKNSSLLDRPKKKKL
jgi:hypothetical protein